MTFGRKKEVILGLMSFGLLACGDSEDPEDKINRLESMVRDLDKKITEINSAFQDVRGAVFKLGFEIEDFSSENWRTNVPDVEYEFEQLKRAVSKVEKKILERSFATFENGLRHDDDFIDLSDESTVVLQSSE